VSTVTPFLSDEEGYMKMGQAVNPRAKRFTLVMLLVIAAYLYTNLFFIPDAPILLGGDQVFFWTYAQRMLHGERIYQDFFQLTPPGTDLLYCALF
jgi:hypothetical protein